LGTVPCLYNSFIHSKKLPSVYIIPRPEFVHEELVVVGVDGIVVVDLTIQLALAEHGNGPRPPLLVTPSEDEHQFKCVDICIIMCVNNDNIRNLKSHMPQGCHSFQYFASTFV